MKKTIFLLLLSLSVIHAAIIKEKSLACEHNNDLNLGYELWQSKDRNFLYFVFKKHCQILKEGAKVDIVKDDNTFSLLDKETSLVRWINGRELWVRRSILER